MSANCDRCLELKAGKPFTEEAKQLIQLLCNQQPDFEKWLYETFLPGLANGPCMLLRTDWNDVDRNVVNTAFVEFRRTPLFRSYQFPEPCEEPPFVVYDE